MLNIETHLYQTLNKFFITINIIYLKAYVDEFMEHLIKGIFKLDYKIKAIEAPGAGLTDNFPPVKSCAFVVENYMEF